VLCDSVVAEERKMNVALETNYEVSIVVVVVVAGRMNIASNESM